MQIIELTAYLVKLPLKREIKHASASRNESTNIFICCRLENGTEGWGEGVPRSYVTGESPDGAIEQLRASCILQHTQADCHNWQDVVNLCDDIQLVDESGNPRACYGNALRCAIELSILDAYGKLFQLPLSTMIDELPEADGIKCKTDSIRYSTTITAENPRSERNSALKMRLFGFRQCKVKVGVEGADDVSRLARIRRWLGSRMDIRLDANEAWHAEEFLEKMQALEQFSISCIEQPIPHQEVSALAELRKQMQIPIMLDESLTSFYDAEQAVKLGTCDIFNIRLSKCGGFINSIRLAAYAHENGLGYQLGCHPGESGILSAAGRHFASSIKNIRYLEGSYDRYLLAKQFTTPDISFTYGGRAKAINKPGLGVCVDTETIQRVAHHQESLRQ